MFGMSALSYPDYEETFQHDAVIGRWIDISVYVCHWIELTLFALGQKE